MAPERPLPRSRILHTYSRKTTANTVQTTPPTGLKKLRGSVSQVSHRDSCRKSHEHGDIQKLAHSLTQLTPAGELASWPPIDCGINKGVEDFREPRRTLLATPFTTTLATGRSLDRKRNEDRSPEEKAARLVTYNQMKSDTARIASSRASRSQLLPTQGQLQRWFQNLDTEPTSNLSPSIRVLRGIGVAEMQSSRFQVKTSDHKQENSADFESQGIGNLELESEGCRLQDTLLERRKQRKLEDLSPIKSYPPNGKPVRLLVTIQGSENLGEPLRRISKTLEASETPIVKVYKADAEFASRGDATWRNKNKVPADLELDGSSISRGELASNEKNDTEEYQGSAQLQKNVEDMKSDRRVEVERLYEFPLQTMRPTTDVNSYPITHHAPDVGRMSSFTSELTENELDVLNIGNNSQTTISPIKDRPSSLKRSNCNDDKYLTPQNNLYDIASQSNIDHDGNTDLESPAHKKRQRPLSGTTRKIPKRNALYKGLPLRRKHLKTNAKNSRIRELPTEGLVFVEERIEYSDLDSDGNDKALELMDDPISQSLESPTCLRRRKTRRNLRAKTAPEANGVQIDHKDFRIPEQNSASVKSQVHRHLYDYGDGFNKDEARPTGQPKPTTIKRCRKFLGTPFPVEVRFGELTIVPCRTQEDPRAGSGYSHTPRQCKGVKKRRKAAIEDSGMHRDVDESEDSNGCVVDVALNIHANEDPRPPSADNPNVTFEIAQINQILARDFHASNSNLKEVQNRTCHRKSAASMCESASAEMSQIQSQRQSENQSQGRVSTSQPTKVVLVKTSQTQKSRKSSDLTIKQQLGMVSIKRNVYVDDSESDSQDSYNDEYETDSEENSDSDSDAQASAEHSPEDLTSWSDSTDEDKCVIRNDTEGRNTQVRHGMLLDKSRLTNKRKSPKIVSKHKIESCKLSNMNADCANAKSVSTEQVALKSAAWPKLNPNKSVSEIDLDIPFSQQITQFSKTQHPASVFPNSNFTIPSLPGSLDARGCEVPSLGEQGCSRPLAKNDFPGYRDCHSIFNPDNIDTVDVDLPSRRTQLAIGDQPPDQFKHRFAAEPIRVSYATRQPSLEFPGFSQHIVQRGHNPNSDDTQRIVLESSLVPVELGCSQVVIHTSSPFIPETQQLECHQPRDIEQPPQIVERQSYQQDYESGSSVVRDQSSCTEIARGVSYQPAQRAWSLSRSRSMYLPTNFRRSTQVMGGSIPSSNESKITAISSPFSSSSPRFPGMRRGPTKSLAILTRQASQKMGTTSSPRYGGRIKSHEIPRLLTREPKR